MRIWIATVVAASAGLLCGFSVQDADNRRLRYDTTGREAPFFYNHVRGDCDEIVHGAGRNSAWGRWRMPLEQVVVGEISMIEAGGAGVSFDCLEGARCIRSERMFEGGVFDAVASHAIPFETLDAAQGFADRVAALRADCVAG